VLVRSDLDSPGRLPHQQGPKRGEAGLPRRVTPNGGPGTRVVHQSSHVGVREWAQATRMRADSEVEQEFASGRRQRGCAQIMMVKWWGRWGSIVPRVSGKANKNFAGGDLVGVCPLPESSKNCSEWLA